jgi:hypothetical protein
MVIGENLTMEKKKQIELLCSLNIDLNFVENSVENAMKASEYSFVELICKNYDKDIDLIFTYNNPIKRSEGVLWTGYWNDGVV